MFWLVPIVYTQLANPPWIYAVIDHHNPLSALILMMRRILMNGESPGVTTLTDMTLASLVSFGIGFLVFRKLKRRFYDHL
jgi:ABC-type polysaccharide/polyol phosphate export permease